MLILARRMLLADKARSLFLGRPTPCSPAVHMVLWPLFDRPSLTLAHGRAALSGACATGWSGAFAEGAGRACVPDPAYPVLALAGGAGKRKGLVEVRRWR